MSEIQKKLPAWVLFLLCGIGGAVIGAVVMALFPAGSSSFNDNAVVASFDGKKVRAGEAFAPIRTRIFDLEEELFRLKEQAISDYVEMQLVDAEAKRQNLSREALLEKEAGGEVAEVPDKDIEEFLKSKNLSLSDPRIKKDDVREYLKYRSRMDKRTTYVNKLRAAAGVKLHIAEPQSPKITAKTDGYPSWGNSNAKVTIIEFSDYQCPFCARAVPVLNEIKKAYGPDKVRIVFRDMPLPSHDRATPASLAAHCANEQGKFWEYHDKLFDNQTKLGDEDFKTYAKELGMNPEKFAECYNTKRHDGLVMNSKREAESLGIQATPSFVINGTMLQGAQPFERFKERIDRALAGGL
jgi:protein-disulfide isomerase